jgi:deoxycytidylate deaminase
LIGVTKIFDERIDFLEDEGIPEIEAVELAEIDRNEKGVTGQRLDKTLHLADFFIRNQVSSSETKKASTHRVLRLLHGDKSLTPTPMEQGMYAAFAAGLRSACLSRQVGAAIASSTGEIVATGCNDVPKAHGGLYQAGSAKDDRCMYRAEKHCFNDFHKHKLQEEIGQAIEMALSSTLEMADSVEERVGLSKERKAHLLDKIYSGTRLKDLIEFSRSVHAEMEAIVSLARVSGAGTTGATLYTTTFPCHSCARHIVAAGIRRVFYIEPYEKSMAKELHDDAISFEFTQAETDASAKVEFVHFEGVSPRRFSQLFAATNRKDDQGNVIAFESASSEKVLPEYLDNYQTFEIKAVEHFFKDLEKIPPSTLG